MLLTPPLIERMTKDPKFHEFSCLQLPPREPAKRQARKGCGSCGSRNKRNSRPEDNTGPVNYNEVKLRIIEMNPEQQQTLKRLLECQHLRVQYRDRGGAMQNKIL